MRRSSRPTLVSLASKAELMAGAAAPNSAKIVNFATSSQQPDQFNPEPSTIMASTNTQSTLSFPRDTFAKLSPHPYLLAHLQPASSSSTPCRANGRTPTQFRTPHINNGSLTHAEGSAVVRIGDTTVVCGVRGEIVLTSNVVGHRVDKSTIASARPGYSEAKEFDLLVPNIELATGCSPAFLPGQPPSTLAQSLSTRIHSLLHSSSLVNGEDLRIWYQPPDLNEQDGMDIEDEEGPEAEVKAYWVLYIDILFISLDGNPFDAAWAAVISALRDVRLPRAYWDADREMILCDDSVAQSRRLNLRGLPVAVTALIFKAKEQDQGRDKRHWILVDPDMFEESLCDESVTIVLDYGNSQTKMLGLSKAGGVIVGKQQMKEIVGLAQRRWTELNHIMKS